MNMMRKILAAIFALLVSAAAYGQVPGQSAPGMPTPPPPTPTGALSFTPAQVFNIADYGAVCDGITDDTTHIQAAFNAAAASTAYTNNSAIHIVGPANASVKGCAITSLNGTAFNVGTSSDPRARVEISNMTLLCSGLGNICMDFTKATYIQIHDFSLRGNCTVGSMPEIGIQFARIDASTSSAWHILDRVNINSCFGLAALYNFASENNSYISANIINANSTKGPINVLGSITAGSGYTNGTYTDVPLTGGSGTGALATIIVSGNAVTSVKVTYQGRDYVAADSLSASDADLGGGGGSGFAIPVTSVTSYAVILDGENYWRATSPNVSITATAATWYSMTLTRIFGGSLRTAASNQTAVLWMANTGHLYMYHSYLLAEPSQYCVTYRDDGLSSGSIPVGNYAMTLDFYCEGNGSAPASAIYFTGSNATPIVTAPTIKAQMLTTASGSFFKADSSTITSITLRNLNLHIGEEANTIISTFASAKLWTVYGNVWVPAARAWNAPAVFQGIVNYGVGVTPPNMGPLDILSSASFAYSCARRLGQSYTGPLCNFVRASDSATLDIYPDVNGNLDRNAFTQFCTGTTCKLVTAYDQSGNGSNATQGTDASRPTFTLVDSHLGNQPSFTIADAGALALSVTAAASNNDLFATNGYISMAVYLVATTQADRLLYKSDAVHAGWDLRRNSGAQTWVFSPGFSTTNGVFTTGNITITNAHIADVQYSDASTSNTPTIADNGTNTTVTTTTAPVGTAGAETNNMLIGNNAATAGTRGCGCSFGEIVGWKASPTGIQVEAVRRNQAAYYGLGTTVN